MTRLRIVAVLLAAGLVASACGADETRTSASLRDRIEVSGGVGARPTIEIETPLEVDESSSWISEQGEGDRVGPRATAILQLTLANGRTGKTLVSTLDEGQRPIEAVLGDQVFPSLVEALTGRPADSRVVVVSTPEDTYGDKGAPQIGVEPGDPVVMVADILSTDPTSVLDGPTGATRAAPASAPGLVEEDGVPARFTFPAGRKPRKLQVVVLREGTGPVVQSPDRVTADFLGQVWGAPKPFQETYTSQPENLSIGTAAGVIPAWDTALQGKREGARVMIVCPPALGYGKTAQPNIPARSTLVFVVDVLGVG